MKKLLFLLLFLLAALQNYGQFDLGIKAGYATSKLNTDIDDITEDIKHNFQFGAFARLGKRLYVQPEVYYAQSGGTLQVSGTNEEEHIKFNNLCVPVMLGFRIINGEKINFRIMAGPTANFIVSKKFSGDEVIETLDEGDFKSIAWGLDAGLGVDLWFLAVDVRYEWGLNDIYEPPVNDETMKSNIFIVSLGFKIF
jgi:hypothetical protein